MKLHKKELDRVEGKIVLGFPDTMSSYMGKYNLYVSANYDDYFGKFYMIQIVGEDKNDKHYQFDFDLDEKEFDDFIEFCIELKKTKVSEG